MEYQKLTGAQFETARRELTERILSAREDPNEPEVFLLDDPRQRPMLRAFVKLDGGLLVVPKIEPI